MNAIRYTIILDKKTSEVLEVHEEPCEKKIDDTPLIAMLANGFKRWVNDAAQKGA